MKETEHDHHHHYFWDKGNKHLYYCSAKSHFNYFNHGPVCYRSCKKS